MTNKCPIIVLLHGPISAILVVLAHPAVGSSARASVLHCGYFLATIQYRRIPRPCRRACASALLFFEEGYTPRKPRPCMPIRPIRHSAVPSIIPGHCTGSSRGSSSRPALGFHVFDTSLRTRGCLSGRFYPPSHSDQSITVTVSSHTRLALIVSVLIDPSIGTRSSRRTGFFISLAKPNLLPTSLITS